MDDKLESGDLMGIPISTVGTALKVKQICMSVYKRVWNQRFQFFLDEIGKFSDEMTEADRLRFEAYINSEDGQELLVDLADHAVRSRNRVAIAALAILLANPVNESFDENFRVEAPHRIEAIPDRSVVTLLAVCAFQRADPDRTVVLLSNIVVANASGLNELGYSASVWLEVLEDLLARQILGSDTSYADLGEGAVWSKVVRVTEKTQLYERLFVRARKALGYQSV